MNLRKNGKIFKIEIEYFSEHKNNEMWDIFKRKEKKNYRSWIVD